MGKLSFLNLLGVIVMSACAILFFAVQPVHGATITITGWLIPDGAHFNNAIGALLFPIIGIGMFAGIARVVDAEGDFGVTLILAGLTVGGLIGMLSLGPSSNNVIPFALVIIPGIDLLIWQWKGGG